MKKTHFSTLTLDLENSPVVVDVKSVNSLFSSPSSLVGEKLSVSNSVRNLWRRQKATRVISLWKRWRQCWRREVGVGVLRQSSTFVVRGFLLSFLVVSSWWDPYVKLMHVHTPKKFSDPFKNYEDLPFLRTSQCLSGSSEVDCELSLTSVYRWSLSLRLSFRRPQSTWPIKYKNNKERKFFTYSIYIGVVSKSFVLMCPCNHRTKV